jgi:hypothetical protein
MAGTPRKFTNEPPCLGREHPVSIDLQRDLQTLAAWSDGQDLDDLPALEKRLLACLPDIPSTAHYALLELIGELAANIQVVTDAELYHALLLLAVSPNDAASVRASALLFRDFNDSQSIDHVRDALANTENPGFYDALFIVAKAAASGRVDAIRLIESAMSDGDIDAETKEVIAAALHHSM